MQNLADKIVEDYDSGGITEVLKLPFVQQLIQAYTRKISGEGIDIPQREKKVQDFINNLPPEVMEKGLKLLKNQKK